MICHFIVYSVMEHIFDVRWFLSVKMGLQTVKAWRYIGKSNVFLILLMIVICIPSVWMEIQIPICMSDITFMIEQGESVDSVIPQGVIMILYAIGSLVLGIAAAITTGYLASSVAKNLRSAEFRKISRFSLADIDRFGIGSLVSRSTNDITQIQMVISLGALAAIKAPIILVISIIELMTLYSFPLWNAITVACIAFTIFVMLMILCITVPSFNKIQRANDRINRLIKDHVSGLRVIHAHNAEEYHEKKFDEINDRLTNLHSRTARCSAAVTPMNLAMTGVLSAAVYCAGITLMSAAGTEEGKIVFAEMMSYTSVALYLLSAFILIMFVFIYLPRAVVAFRRVNEIIETEPLLTESTADSDNSMNGEISFRNVGFRYEGNPNFALKDVSFDVGKGEKVALVGPTGSGKTTVVKLIQRLYDVSEGSVSIDGVDVKDYRFSELNRKFGYVPQKTMLFNDTLENNIRLCDDEKEISDEKMKQAASVSECSEFISNMPDGYRTILSDGAGNISGGQKQRISLARALYRRPEIFIFDDPLRALDSDTKKAIRRSLDGATIGTTMFFVTQKLELAKLADRIIVMDSGRVVGCGTHEQLEADCDFYCRFFKIGRERDERT